MTNAQSSLNRSAAQRARWLAELAAAIEEASRLLLRLSDHDHDAAVALVQIIGLRSEVDAIRRGSRFARETVHPNWMS